MSEKYDDARALRVMVETLRAEPPPELDWNAVEVRLFATIDRREREAARSAAPPSPFGRIFGLAAAAAVLALGIGSIASSGRMQTAIAPPERVVDAASARPAAGDAGARGERDLLGLQAGDVIEAKGGPVTFSRAGAVAWTLESGGRIRVRGMGAAGVGHTVALERGSIRAEVTPRDPSEGLVESFAVEVENTRVAVHGTAFTVTREAEQIVVDVEHGAVAVGPVGHQGVTTGHLLVGPARASFSFDGGRTARRLARMAPAVIASAAAAPSAPPPAVVAAAAPPHVDASAHDAPDAPSINPAPAASQAPRALAAAQAHVEKPAAQEPPSAAPPPTLTVDTVRARLNQCMKRVYGDVPPSVQVGSTLRIVIKDDGTVQAARFDPPLKPEFQSCAGGAIAGRFNEGARTIEIPVAYSR